MRVKCFPGGSLLENTYVYCGESAGAGIVIDPGAGAEAAGRWARLNGVDVTAALFTHGHADHTEGCAELRRAFPEMKAYAVREEGALFEDACLNLGGLFKQRFDEVKISAFFSDGEIFEAGPVKLKVLRTPGHTAGSACYYDEKNGGIFSGDTLFFHEVGRTDLPTGDWETLKLSVREVLYKLPDGAFVYPGHGRRTTIGEEKAENPHVPETGG